MTKGNIVSSAEPKDAMPWCLTLDTLQQAQTQRWRETVGNGTLPPLSTRDLISSVSVRAAISQVGHQVFTNNVYNIMSLFTIGVHRHDELQSLLLFW